MQLLESNSTTPKDRRGRGSGPWAGPGLPLITRFGGEKALRQRQVQASAGTDPDQRFEPLR